MSQRARCGCGACRSVPDRQQVSASIIEVDSQAAGDFKDPTALTHVVTSTAGRLVASFGPVAQVPCSSP